MGSHRLLEKFDELRKNKLQIPAAKHGVVILVDPPSVHYHKNIFFDLNTPLNRDNTLRANFNLKAKLEGAGYPVFTADCYDSIASQYLGCEFHYWSFGAPAVQALAFSGTNVKKVGVALFEPPLVKPLDYEKIELLAADFDHVYLHNVIGDGYKLPSSQLSKKIVKFYWTNKNFDNSYAESGKEKRLAKIALISGAHFAKAQPDNGYGKRLSAIKISGFKGDLDLFGFGWRKFQIRSPFSSLYWSVKLWMANEIVPKPDRKSDVYRRYDFALCFENMAMSGYITEKIFDALFAKSIPIYWGAPDIADYIPSNCFIALDHFDSIEACFNYCRNLTQSEKAGFRKSIESFLNSQEFAKFETGIHGLILNRYKVV
jgi:hypothetical protein